MSDLVENPEDRFSQNEAQMQNLFSQDPVVEKFGINADEQQFSSVYQLQIGPLAFEMRAISHLGY